MSTKQFFPIRVILGAQNPGTGFFSFISSFSSNDSLVTSVSVTPSTNRRFSNESNA